MEIGAWLDDLGLGQYKQAFRENHIDGSLLDRLTAEDLSAIGVASVGHRRRLLDAIAAQSTGAGSLAVVEAAAPASAQVQPERRQLTIMFVDLVGSTARSARLDPEEMSDLLRGYQNAVAGEIARYEGHIAKFMGDGVLAYFGWPRAHEDEAERAVRAALATVEAVKRLPIPDNEPLAIRIGIATGLVVVGELIGEGAASEEVVVGDTPNLAARLQALAEPNGIVLGAATRRLLGQHFTLKRLGPLRIKGLEQPIAAFSVLAERQLESRFAGRHCGGPAPIVGREQELALLLERWRQAAGGEGQLVLLTGEAGIGKSRITEALVEAIRDEPHYLVRYQCSPYHTDSPLYPAVQQLTHAAGFNAADTPERRLSKLETLLLGAGDAPGDTAPLLAALLDLDAAHRFQPLNLTPQQRRSRTLALLIDQLVGLGQQQPVLWAIEDVHWIDPTTLELIELALDRAQACRLLILVTARPTFTAAIASHPTVTRLTLNRLSRDAIQLIITRITRGHPLPEGLLDKIAGRSDGVPLFIEEMTKAILESGLLSETAGSSVPDGRLDELAIPTSLHDSLMARLDRAQVAKHVAQIAAVIGREFDHATLVAISPVKGEELDAALEHLATAELIFRRGTPPDVHYRFKHALLRDAAYESLLKSRRQELHAGLARYLEERGSDIAHAQPELLAHHLTRAGLPERALPFWQIAGERAARDSANLEAIAHFRQALRLVESLPRDERSRVAQLRLQTLLMGPLIATSGYWADETIAVYDRALELWRDDDEPALHYSVIYGQIVGAVRRSGLAKALELAREFVARAEAEGDTGPMVVARRVSGLFHFFVGKTEQARRELVHALREYDAERHEVLTHQYGQNQRVSILTNLSITEWMLGYPGRAADLIAQAIDEARRSRHDYTLAYALTYGALQVHYCRRDALAVARASRELAEFASSRGLTLCHAFAQIGIGWSLAHDAGDHRAIERVAEGIAGLDASRTYYFRPFLLLLSAESQRLLGSAKSALASLDEALAVARERRDVWLEPELIRRRALVRSDLAAPIAEVEDDLSRAIEMARDRAARSFELRASRDLAALRAEKGERQQAHDLLTPVYDRFTEGFDTPDLIEARALLDELR